MTLLRWTTTPAADWWITRSGCPDRSRIHRVALSVHVVLADQALSRIQGVMAGLGQMLAGALDIETTTIRFE